MLLILAKIHLSFLIFLCPDFAFAALAAPLILPQKYCGGEFNVVFDQLYLDAKLQVEREWVGGGSGGEVYEGRERKTGKREGGKRRRSLCVCVCLCVSVSVASPLRLRVLQLSQILGPSF